MSKKYYVPMNQVLQMIQEELNMNLGEIKEFTKSVQVSLRKKDLENEIDRNVEMTTPEFSHGFIPLKKIESLDDWTREDIPLTRRSFQNTVYYEQCKSKIDLLEYLHTVCEKDKREVFMMLTCIQTLEQKTIEENQDLITYLDLHFDDFGKLDLDDAIRLSLPVIQNVIHLKELRTYISTLQSEVCKLLYAGALETQLDWEHLYPDEFQIVDKRKVLK